MKAQAPNYLYPLATDRTLQWTRDAVKGESSAKKPFQPKRYNPAKKEIIKNVIKGKKRVISKVIKTRDFVNPTLKGPLPEDPMKAPDPTPGNAMHISNTKAWYNGTQN